MATMAMRSRQLACSPGPGLGRSRAEDSVSHCRRKGAQPPVQGVQDVSRSRNYARPETDGPGNRPLRGAIKGDIAPAEGQTYRVGNILIIPLE